MRVALTIGILIGLAQTVTAHPVVIDPAGYAGQYGFQGGFHSGAKTFDLPTGSYTMSIGGWGGLLFSVDASGSVSLGAGYGGSATTAGNVLTFKNTTIEIEPDAFLGQHSVSRVTPWQTGRRSFVVVPAQRYAVAPGAWGGILFDVDAAGDVSVRTGYEGSATAAGSVLTFNNVIVTVDPGTYTDQWAVSRVAGWFTGIQSTVLVPAQRYAVNLRSGEGALFDVGAACELTPNPVSVGAETFTLSCTVHQQHPPTADAGPDRNVGCSQTVTLDGTGSSDPDGDALTYTWTGPFGLATGPTPTVQLGFGTHTITLTVDDGNGNTDTDEVAITVAPCPCPLGQGYWKNHPQEWPVSTLRLGSEDYTQGQLRGFLRKPVRGDASLILVKQLIATKLNLAHGSDPTPIAAVVAEADALLAAEAGRLPYDVHPGSAAGQAMTAAAAILDDYNNGRLTPNCGAAASSNSSGGSGGSSGSGTPPAQTPASAAAQAAASPPATGVSAGGGSSAPPPGGGSSGGCSLAAEPGSAPGPLGFLVLLLALVGARRR